MATFVENLFADKTAFIAGGTSGINLGIAKRLAGLGCKVTVAGRNLEKATAAAAEIGDRSKALGLSCDVRDYEAVEAALQQAVDSFGKLDIVVSGAAGNFLAPALGMSANGFRTVVDIDLNGTFNVFRACYQHLNRPDASLIAISASQAVNAAVNQAHVCAAKAGINHLCNVLAMEWGPEGVRVNGISPGPIDGTEGLARVAPTPAARRAMELRVPLRRYGTKDEIGDAAVFLSSDAARYITGTMLYVNGGSHLGDATPRDPSMGLA